MAQSRLAIHTRQFDMGESEMKTQKKTSKPVKVPAPDEKCLDMQNRWDQGIGPSINKLGALKRPDSSDSPLGPSDLREKARLPPGTGKAS